MWDIMRRMDFLARRLHCRQHQAVVEVLEISTV